MNTVSKSKKPAKKNYGLLNTFNISDENLNLQVENYETLPISKSSRGIAVLTIIALLGIGLAVIVFLKLIGTDVPISYSDVMWTLIVYAPLLYFVYKGHLWAIIALGLWYTADKLYSSIIISPSHFNISAVIFWLIGIGPLWVAFRVEREYRKKKILAKASQVL